MSTKNLTTDEAELLVAVIEQFSYEVALSFNSTGEFTYSDFEKMPDHIKRHCRSQAFDRLDRLREWAKDNRTSKRKKTKSTFFLRGNQIWKKKINGDMLLINLQEKGHHYEGDSHIFLRRDQFNQVGAMPISEEEFCSLRDGHLNRLHTF